MALPEPVSPCCQVCRLDREDVCIGCGRTAREIRDWPVMDHEQRWAVLRAAAERRRARADAID